MGPYLMTKLKNRVRKANDGLVPLEFDLRNDVVNGRKLGCCGYIENVHSGRCVYVNTDEVCGGGYEPLAGKAMVRYEDNPEWLAEDGRLEHDQRHYGQLARQNQWVDQERLAWAIFRMLTAPEPVNVELEGRESSLASGLRR